ncbi:MAG: protease pro-enzyme activation domain-containing protein [Terriglobales bacterium]
MSRNKMSFAFYLLAVLSSLSLLFVPIARAGNGRPVLITQNVDESKLVALAGNTRPEANPKYDRGRVADGFPMEHMMLQLKRSPEQERELRKLIEDLTDSSSPNFHQWLSAKEFGERFGLAQPDLDTITHWLESHGLKVNVVYENGVLIDFSGTAGQVRTAFHTDIHQLNVKGEKHIANMSDPKIPAALVPAVEGVVSLHDFRPHTQYKARANYTAGNGDYLVAPADLATIYNLNPLFSQGISGQGQTIALIEDSDIYAVSDWTTFRSAFALSQYTNGSLTQIHPLPASGPNNCTDPGVQDAVGEATLDVEWASAAAPSAAIELVSCVDTATTFGGLIAMQNLFASSAPPAVVSISYGECEAVNGAASNAAYAAAYQQAVAEGVSVFVAAGDESASSCAYSQGYSTYGIGVSGFASSPYNVAVGGTDFGDTYAGTNSTYWSATNSSTYESALSYIPEIPWEDSCGSLLIAQYEGYSQTYGSSGFCNSSAGSGFENVAGGSGGPSGCATGTPSVSGVVGGTCAGNTKPAWQSLVGNPNDGVRDLPDVSLFAANGVWGHYYPFCIDSSNGGCVGAPDDDTWSGAGGTSFASPIMAGFQALVNQKSGERQGNPNPVYYSLAAKEYGAGGDSSCNSTLGNAVSGSCIFYDVTLGDINIPCIGPNCYQPSGGLGVLSTSTNGCDPTNAADGDCGAYIATTGWDFATGIGSVNVTNLVNGWPTSAPNFIALSSPNSLLVNPGGSATSTITITPVNGFSGSVTLSASGLPTGVTAAFSANPVTSTSTLTLTATAKAAKGTATVTITGTSGNLMNTIPISLTVASPSLSASPSTVTLDPGSSVTSAITIVFSGNVTLAASGLPAGVTAAFSPNPATSSSVLTLTAASTTKLGNATVTITGTSGNLRATTKIKVTPGNFALWATPADLTLIRGNSGASTIAIHPENGFDGNVTLSASKLPAGVTASISPNPATSSSTLTLNVSDSAAIGPATITITGTSGSLVRTATIKLTTLLPNFTLSVLPNALIITPGTSGTTTVTITPTNTFDQNVTLSASGMPDGVTASFSPNPATSSSMLTVAVNSSAKAVVGKTMIITGTSGSLSHTTTVSLTVTK